jgi:hypothetical protein
MLRPFLLSGKAAKPRKINLLQVSNGISFPVVLVLPAVHSGPEPIRCISPAT